MWVAGSGSCVRVCVFVCVCVCVCVCDLCTVEREKERERVVDIVRRASRICMRDAHYSWICATPPSHMPISTVSDIRSGLLLIE